jgi:hypothetical protein
MCNIHASVYADDYEKQGKKKYEGSMKGCVTIISSIIEII